VRSLSFVEELRQKAAERRHWINLVVDQYLALSPYAAQSQAEGWAIDLYSELRDAAMREWDSGRRGAIGFDERNIVLYQKRAEGRRRLGLLPANSTAKAVST
jgi:hypothetical protein